MPEHSPGLEDYLKILTPYDSQLARFEGRAREYGGRFALLFRRIVRMLVKDSNFNKKLPSLYVHVAQRYLAQEPEVVRHFSYEDNRHFFLKELRDWIATQESGEKLCSTRERV